MSDKEKAILEMTGFDTVGFRPLLSQIAVKLDEEHRMVLGGLSPALPKEEEMEKGKIWLGSEVEKEKLEKELLYEVVAISKHIATLEDAVRVGDKVAFGNNSKVNELKVGDQYYGIFEMRNVIAVVKEGTEFSKA